MDNTTFIVDKFNSDNEYFYVDIAGVGTVQIHVTDDGVSVDMFPLNIDDSCVASCWASYGDFGLEENA